MCIKRLLCWYVYVYILVLVCTWKRVLATKYGYLNSHLYLILNCFCLSRFVSSFWYELHLIDWFSVISFVLWRFCEKNLWRFFLYFSHGFCSSHSTLFIHYCWFIEWITIKVFSFGSLLCPADQIYGSNALQVLVVSQAKSSRVCKSFLKNGCDHNLY